MTTALDENTKLLFSMVKEPLNVSSTLKNVFYIMQLNWNGLLVPKCLIILKKFLLTLLLRNGKREFKIYALGDRTMERYTQVIEEYILEYVDPLSKDYMIKYLKDFHRPVHTKPRDHATRMETLVRYTNRLPGTEPDITPQQTKNMIFESFPVTWKQSWIRAGKSLVTNTLAEQFNSWRMSNHL
jgi:hypothetical protein